MTDIAEEIILDVKDIVIKFNLRGQTLTAIRGTSLDVRKGETLAIVGESGSGKSVLTKSFLGMLDKNGWVDSGSILFEGQDLAAFRDEKPWLSIRGKKISMVFQDPMTSLNPLKNVGAQIAEVYALHRGYGAKQATDAAIEILDRVGIPTRGRGIVNILTSFPAACGSASSSRSPWPARRASSSATSRPRPST